MTRTRYRPWFWAVLRATWWCQRHLAWKLRDVLFAGGMVLYGDAVWAFPYGWGRAFPFIVTGSAVLLLWLVMERDGNEPGR